MSTTYDYIIVGGGTAGLVLANRLSEDEKISVLVLEAGGACDEDPKVAIPGLWRANANTENDWAFETVPQTHMDGRTVKHMQGKLLGGTSSINAQVLMPPSEVDMDAWEKIGNTGWSWKTMKPYLQGFYSISEPEKATHDRLRLDWSKSSWVNGDASGSGGPVQASFTHVIEEDPLAAAWVDTFAELGYPLTDNPFDGTSTGSFNGVSTVDPLSKARVSSSTAYYQPIKDRKNLHVETGCTVEKVALDRDGAGEFNATGVQYVQGGEQKIVSAGKEVILCAGAFQSPKILELSGIGDPDILSRHGIQVKVANPYVGTNLQDHLMESLSFELRNGLPSRDGLLRRDREALTAAMSAFTPNKLGPLGSSAVTSFAYLPVDEFKNDIQQREAFLEQLVKAEKKHPLDDHRIAILRDLIQTPTGGTAQYFPFIAQASMAGGALQPGNFVTVVVALSHPLSTGTVHISSANPLAKPTIDNEYLSHPLDVEIHARHIRYVEKLAATSPFAALLKGKDGLRNDPSAFIGDDLNKAKEYLKVAGASNGHPCGTCAMAPEASGGVLDSELRVYGVGNLRVVDASIFPLVPQSNTQSLVYAVAEMAADIIRGKLGTVV